MLTRTKLGVTVPSRLSEDLTDEDLRILNRLLYILDKMREIRQTMPVHLVTALLRVARDEGKSVIQYARDSEVSQSVMSRHLIDLSTVFRGGEPGLGLVEKRNAPDSLREQQVFLTPKGRKLVKEIIRILEHGSPVENGR